VEVGACFARKRGKPAASIERQEDGGVEEGDEGDGVVE
tara:strand:+ start:2133 stop:2246 length:114 start_codon:yes stop_codon:yes gene_type:complete